MRLAITVYTCHKLIDGVSLGIFVNSWTTTARAVQANRFVFDTKKIDRLRAEVSSASVPRPSRVEALTALIWKCARAASRSNLGYSRPSLSAHAINVRAVAEPPLPDNSVGNSVAYLMAQASEKEIETLQDLVCSLRKAKAEFRRNGLKTLLENKSIFDIPESIKDKFEKDEIDFYTFSSIVNFPYYEAADFGWGKPVHLTFPNYLVSNLIMLMDTNDACEFIRKGPYCTTGSFSDCPAISTNLSCFEDLFHALRPSPKTQHEHESRRQKASADKRLPSRLAPPTDSVSGSRRYWEGAFSSCRGKTVAGRDCRNDRFFHKPENEVPVETSINGF
ncbi:hypothetical protein WN943_006578 [Citrus x changshan-huyou]